MKTLFTIPSDSLLILDSYSKLINKMSDITNKQFFVVSDKTLSVYVTGRQSILTFDVDIDGYSSDKDEDFIALNYDKFITTASKLTNNDSISVSIEENGLKLLLKSTNAKSKVTLSCFDTTSEDEVNSIKREYSELKDKYFSKNVRKINLTDGLVDFAKVSGKFMKLTMKSNSILVGRKVVKYADNTSIVEYSSETQLLESDIDGDEVIVHNMVLDLVDSLGSECEKYVLYSEDGEFASYGPAGNGNIKFIVNVPSTQFDYPSKDDELMLIPAEGESVKVEVLREKFLTALNVFDGIFESSNWKWKPLKFSYKKDADLSINLSHSDSNAEAETDFTLLSCIDNISANEASFIFSSEFYKNVLDFGQSIFKKKFDKANPTEDIIVIEFNEKSPDEENGLGVVISSKDGSLRAIFAKSQD